MKNLFAIISKKSKKSKKNKGSILWKKAENTCGR